MRRGDTLTDGRLSDQSYGLSVDAPEDLVVVGQRDRRSRRRGLDARRLRDPAAGLRALLHHRDRPVPPGVRAAARLVVANPAGPHPLPEQLVDPGYDLTVPDGLSDAVTWLEGKIDAHWDEQHGYYCTFEPGTDVTPPPVQTQRDPADPNTDVLMACVYGAVRSPNRSSCRAPQRSPRSTRTRTPDIQSTRTIASSATGR